MTTTMHGIDQDTLRQLVTALSQFTWKWSAGQAPELAQAMGWPNFEAVPDGAFADAPWNAGGRDIEFVYNVDRVNRVILPVTASAAKGDPGVDDAVRNALADAAAALTGALGPHTADLPGDRPETRWRRADDTFVLKHIGRAVNLDWAANDWLDEWDKL